MENYKITFLHDALIDLEEIVLYIASDSKEKALKWHSVLINKVENLSIFPEMGVVVPDKKIQKLNFRMLHIENYIVFYKVFEQQKEITILRVLNAKRNYPNLFNI